MTTTYSPRFTTSLVYATTLGAYGILMPFLPIILHEQGFSDAQTNVILATQGIAALFSPLLIGHLADRHVSARSLLSTIFFSCASLTPLWLLSKSVLVASAITFLFFGLCVPAISILDAFVVSLSNTAPTISPKGKSFTFQSVRIWGSIGFVIPGLLLLPLSQVITINSTVLLVIGALCMAAAGFSSLLLPPYSPVQTGSATPSRDAARAARKPPLRQLFQASAVVGIALSMFYSVFPRFLQELGCSHTMVSLIINIGVLWEILLMPFTSHLIARFGANNLVMLGIISLPVRLLVVCLFPVTWLIVALQILHAPLVLGLLVCIPIILGQLARPEYRFSLQSLHTVLMYGFARIVGPLFAAAIAWIYGADGTGALEAILLVAGALAGIAAALLLPVRRRDSRE